VDPAVIAGADGTGGPGLEADLAVDREGFSLELALRIEPGSTVALLGPNGAGKSTAVETLAGLLGLSRGSIELGGRVLDRPEDGRFVAPERRNIGVVFQDYLLFDHLTVLDNVAFGPRHRGLGRRAAREAARSVLDALDLADMGQLRPGRLSGGQAQRVALARALAGGPDLLLLDEPLAAVDVQSRGRLRRLLADHLDRFPGPRLLITHDPTEAFALADHLVVVEGGRAVQEGTPAGIRRHPATPYVAELTGTNLLSGTLDGGTVTVEGTGFELTTASPARGPVTTVIDPRAVSLHLERPEGSPRNTWCTTIEWIEPLGLTTRVRLGAPLPLMVDITQSSAAALGLGPGRSVWAAVKATEITVRAR
jgi:molybdate transport system ATP-binding protein